jgi:hypothetical protein
MGACSAAAAFVFTLNDEIRGLESMDSDCPGPAAANTNKNLPTPPQMPIESNPATMGKMLRKLGLAEEYNCHDVLSTEEWALAMVPQPVLAVLLLFCVKPATEALRTEQEERLRAAGTAPPRDLWFTEQHIPNACGTIGLLHAVINNSTAFGGEISLGEPRVVKRGRRAGARGPAHCLLDS